MPFTEDIKPKKVYNLAYFINKFELIPADQWAVSTFHDDVDGARCALGHCGMKGELQWDTELDWNPEASALYQLAPDIMDVNDGIYGMTSTYGTSPKERVVNYLRAIKNGEV